MIKRLLSKIIRVGRVKAVYPDRATVRVQFDDLSEIQSAELQVLMRRTEKDMDYDMFTLDEQVLCLFLPIARNTGFVIGSIYTVSNVPEDFVNKKIFKFDDETEISYDRSAQLFKLYSTKDITVTAVNDIKIEATNITLSATENLNLNCKRFILDASESAKIKTPTLTIEADATTMSGTLGVDEDITTKKDVIAEKCTLNTHYHNHTDKHDGGPSIGKTTPPTG